MFDRKSIALVVACSVAGTFSIVAAAAGPAATQPNTSNKGFEYAGNIVAEDGKAIVGAEVIASYAYFGDGGMGYIDQVTTDAHGHFSIHRDRAMSGATPAGVAGKVISLEFRHPDYAFARLQDMSLFDRDQLTHLQVSLHSGRTLSGQVVDANHVPVAGASVEMTFGKVYGARRGDVTDGTGHFVFRGLPDEPVTSMS